MNTNCVANEFNEILTFVSPIRTRLWQWARDRNIDAYLLARMRRGNKMPTIEIQAEPSVLAQWKSAFNNEKKRIERDMGITGINLVFREYREPRFSRVFNF